MRGVWEGCVKKKKAYFMRRVDVKIKTGVVHLLHPDEAMLSRLVNCGVKSSLIIWVETDSDWRVRAQALERTAWAPACGQGDRSDGRVECTLGRKMNTLGPVNDRYIGT